MTAQRSVPIIPGDIKPRHKGKRKVHRLTMSRAGLARFVRYMMWQEGYFVTAAQLKLRTQGRGCSTAGFTDPETGDRYRGVFAWALLAEDAQLSLPTVQKVARGEHRRSPELYTIAKLFKALRLDIQAITSDDSNVEMVVRGW